MAISAGAALLSAGAVAAELVAVETLAMVAIGATVVGVATGNKTLTKIGAGIGLGSFVAGPSMLNLGASTAGAGVAGPAAETLAGQGALGGAEAGAAAAAGTSGAPLASTAAGTPFASAGGAPLAGVDYGLTNSLSSGLPGGLTGGLPVAPGAPLASAGIGEGGISAWANAAVPEATLTRAPWYSANPSVTPALKSSTSWWGGFKDWWAGLDKTEKLVAGQIGMGTIKGVGEGLMQQQAEDRKYEFLENERDWRRRNLDYQPNFAFSTNPGVVNSAIRGS